MSIWIFAFAFSVHALPSRAGVCHALLDAEAQTHVTAEQIQSQLERHFQRRRLEWAQMNARLREASREIKLRVYVGSGRQADATSLQALTRAMFTQEYAAREVRGEAAIRQKFERQHLAGLPTPSRYRPAKIALGLIPPLVTLALLGNQHFNPVWTYDSAVEYSFGTLFALALGGSLLHARDHRFATEIEAIENFLDHPEANKTNIIYSSLRLPRDRGAVARLNERGYFEHLGEVTLDLLRHQARPVVYFWQMFYFDEQTGEPVWWLGTPKL